MMFYHFQPHLVCVATLSENAAVSLHALSGLRFLGPCQLQLHLCPTTGCLAAREDCLFKLLFLISSRMRLSGWSSIVEFLAKQRFSNCSVKTFLSRCPLYIIKLLVDGSSSTVKVTQLIRGRRLSILARISVFFRDFSSSPSFAQDFAKPFCVKFIRFYSLV